MVLIINSSALAHISLLCGEKSEVLTLGSKTSSAEVLLPCINEVLKKHKKTLKDINTVAVCVGPGSFTGTRVALSTAFAICFALNCKLVKFNLFELLGKNGIIGASGGYYVCENGKIFFSQESIDANSFDFDIAGKKNVNLTEKEIECVRKKIAAKEFVSINECKPLYVQNSQAENELVKKLKFEKCTKDYIKKLAEIEKECFSHNVFNEKMLEGELLNNHYYCALFNNSIVGFAGFSKAGSEGELVKIAVLKSFRGAGIAKAIFEFALKNLNLKTVYLEVNKKNHSAINLYYRLGFVKTGERKNYYENNDDAIIMKLGI